MRLIGHLGEKASAVTFSDFLYVQGIGNDVEPEKEGWAIWVHGEDEVPKAKELLAQFKMNPGDPKYQKQAREANQLKEAEAKEEAKAKNRYFDRTKLLEQGRTYRIGPLTVMLVVACVAVAVMSKMGSNREVLRSLFITQFNFDGSYIEWAPGLPEIRTGQIWRLITPIFIHFGAPHLIFNMLATLDLIAAAVKTKPYATEALSSLGASDFGPRTSNFGQSGRELRHFFFGFVSAGFGSGFGMR